MDIDAVELEAIIDKVVSAKLAPINRALAKQQEAGPGLRDMIGWILGLLGIATYIWSHEGINMAIMVTLKCNAILLMYFAFVSGISLSLVGCSLERLHVPAKLVFLFLFTCRYIHVIGDEWRRLWTAAKLRAFEPCNSMHTYRTIGNMLGLTLINAIDRSRRV